MRRLGIAVVIGLVVAAAACGDDDTTTDTVGPSTSTTATTTTAATTTEPAATTTEPAATTTETTETTTTTTEAAPATTPPASTSAPAPTTAAPTMIDVRVYLLRGERLAIAHRQVPGPAVLRGALNGLLAGPTSAEAAEGLATVIPDGTSLRDLNLADGIATVDLTREFESGGGSMSMTARIAQVVFTATQFDNVEAVQFWLDGEPIDFLGGEGIVLDEPRTRSDSPRELTGGILFDLPRPGSTVTSPFTVTGEGDVYEGDFPLRVRRNGNQLGDVVIVRAGAWGRWDDFSTTVTVDAGPGPIELVAVDESGCGPPECPAPTEIVVPLTLAD